MRAEVAQQSTVTPSTSDEAAQRQRLTNLGGVVTDETVPEGHKGLHGFLYGDGGADVHDSPNGGYTLQEGEDDGTQVVPFEQYVGARDAQRFAGVYAIYDQQQSVQYIGFSRSVVLSLKGPNGAGTAAMSEEERTQYEEKKLKMRKAMGENLYDDVDGETLDSKERRMRLLQATEGDDWSSVIDGQTKDTLDPRLATPGTDAAAAVGALEAATAEQEEAAAPPEAQIVSPFMRPGALPLGEAAAAAAPVEMSVSSVDKALDQVRPYLIADGGNVEVVGVENGVVFLRLQGACGTCPSSTATMKMGIERSLQATFGEQLKEVMQVDKIDISASITAVNAHLDMLRPAIQNFGGSVEVISVDSSRGTCEVKYKGPPPIGMGIQAAIKDKFPDIRKVVLLDA
eukprot:jgi/Mesen1/3635/ME000020S03162